MIDGATGARIVQTTVRQENLNRCHPAPNWNVTLFVTLSECANGQYNKSPLHLASSATYLWRLSDGKWSGSHTDGYCAAVHH